MTSPYRLSGCGGRDAERLKGVVRLEAICETLLPLACIAWRTATATVGSSESRPWAEATWAAGLRGALGADRHEKAGAQIAVAAVGQEHYQGAPWPHLLRRLESSCDGGPA